MIPATHHLVLAYDQTLTQSKDLILFVLWEPNTPDTICDNGVGPYDFNEFPRCAAWNCAYNLLAKYNGLTTSGFKQVCKDAHASPILFTDALSKGILNKVGNKFPKRETLINPLQAERIMSQPFMNRIRLIVLSGLQKDLVLLEKYS